MASDPNHSRFLDELRRESDAVRKTTNEQHRPIEEVLRDMDRQLWSAFRWLEEALKHLEIIRPRVRHTFRLSGVLEIAAPQYERGFVSFRRRNIAGVDLLEHVDLFYRLANQAPVVLKVQAGSVTATEDRLRAAQLQFRYDAELNERRAVTAGTFTVAPEITSSVRFQPDYRRQHVEVTLNNIDRFESLVLDFGATAIDDSALEDLVHLMLGKSNRFLRRAPLAGLGARRHDDALASAAAHGASRSVA